jgi:hypothetical protein
MYGYKVNLRWDSCNTKIGIVYTTVIQYSPPNQPVTSKLISEL